MHRLFVFVVSMMLLISPAAFARPDHSVIRDYAHLVLLKKSTFALQSVLVGSGTAIVIAPGYALSARHVFDTAAEGGATVTMMNGDKEIPVEVVKKTEGTDTVLISGKFGCPCAPIALSMPEVDTEVFGVGFPLYHLYGVQYVTQGHYQGSTLRGNERLAAITTHASRGGSGGGVFFKQDGVWRLFGILSSIGFSHLGPPSLGLKQEHSWITFAVPLDDIKTLIKDTNAEPIPPATTEVQ
jgi:S1-C subfamily serine protease